MRIKWESRTDAETGHRYAILRWTEQGKRRSRALGYLSLAEAQEARGDLEASLRLQVALPTDSSVRVADLLTVYLEDLDHRAISENYAYYELWRCRTLRARIGHLVADQVNASTLARYRGDRSRETTSHGRPPSRSTIRSEISTLRRAYRNALERGIITCQPPAWPVGRMRDDARPPRRLTEQDVATLIRVAHEDRMPGWGWLVQALAWCGRRPIAVLAVEVEDLVRLREERLPRHERLLYWRKDKGGVSRGWGPLTEPAYEALLARAEEVGEGRLWCKRTKGLHYPIKRTADRAGVPDVQVYDLRRFAVTQILSQLHGEVRQAMRYTGHIQPSTLMRYAYDHQGAAEAAAHRIGWSPEPLRMVEDGDG